VSEHTLTTILLVLGIVALALFIAGARR